MNEADRIVDQYDRVINGDAWHGDPVWKILDGITAGDAAFSPNEGANSIWHLILHMKYWENIVERQLRGLPREESEALNFPALPGVSEENWQSTLRAFRKSNAAFREALVALDPARLDELSPTGNYSFYVEAHGLVQHHVYHAGQIALLRRLQRSQRKAASL
jgi:hypothetical protein